MHLFDLREPINAWSHGVGMLSALPVTWILWNRCTELADCSNLNQGRGSRFYQRIKALCLLIFGISLIICYGTSAAFHGVRLAGASLNLLQRLDHIGIYILIAGTYTPVAWSLMRGSWWWGTLTTVWTTALFCGLLVWCGGVMPMWVATLTYLAMGWGALFCYFELAKTYSHRMLAPLPLGGMFYSVGAVLNLARWPVLVPGVFASHELFHCLVIAGSACHVFFMIDVVVPSRARPTVPGRANSPLSLHQTAGVSVRRRRILRRPHFFWRPSLARLSAVRPVPEAADGLERGLNAPNNAVEMA